MPKQVTYTVYGYNELDELIIETLGLDRDMMFSLVALNEWGNYQYHAFTIEAELDTWDTRDFQELMVALGAYAANPGDHDIRAALWSAMRIDLLGYALYQCGVLEPGNYLVRVYW